MCFSIFKSILVVQDCPELETMIYDTLNHHGFTVHCVESNQEAIAYLESRQPHLLLLDLGMPGVRCWDVVQYARERYNIPIIAMTGYGANVKRCTGPLQRIDHYLVKPFTAQQLLGAVQALLGVQAVNGG